MPQHITGAGLDAGQTGDCIMTYEAFTIQLDRLRMIACDAKAVMILRKANPDHCETMRISTIERAAIQASTDKLLNLLARMGA